MNFEFEPYHYRIQNSKFIIQNSHCDGIAAGGPYPGTLLRILWLYRTPPGMGSPYQRPSPKVLTQSRNIVVGISQQGKVRRKKEEVRIMKAVA